MVVVVVVAHPQGCSKRILGWGWPRLWLCCPSLGPAWRHPRGHFVGPCWPILSHKIEKMRKMGKPQNTVNCGTSDRSAHRGQGRRQAWEPLSPASYGEDREKAYGSATAGAVWAPGRILELTLIVGSAGLLDPRCHRRVGLKAIIEWGPAPSETYSLCFFEHIHGCVKTSVWKVSACKSSLCKDFFA